MFAKTIILSGKLHNNTTSLLNEYFGNIIPNEYPNKAFTKYGILTLEFDRKSQMLLRNWKSSSPETGIVRKGNVFIIKDSKVDLKNLPFGKEHRGKVKITFQTSKKTPQKIYHVAVRHMTYIGRKESEIGGVAFEIDTQLK